MVPLAAMDAAVTDWLTSSPYPVVDRVFVPGSNHDAEIEQVNMALRELPALELDEDAEDAERLRLRTERRRLEALTATPDTWQEQETGETWGDMFTRLSGDTEALREAMAGKVRFRVFRDADDFGARILDHGWDDGFLGIAG
jgi:hypothetical protein